MGVTNDAYSIRMSEAADNLAGPMTIMGITYVTSDIAKGSFNLSAKSDGTLGTVAEGTLVSNAMHTVMFPESKTLNGGIYLSSITAGSYVRIYK
ncbi:MAG: hypothetical protein ABID54_14245 [Pseudomonadota bacterium]